MLTVTYVVVQKELAPWEHRKPKEDDEPFDESKYLGQCNI